MKNNATAAADGAPSAPETTAAAAEPMLMVTVLVNGIVIGDAHHAAGKLMPVPKSKAEALAAMNPPGVRIDGVA